MKVGVLTSSRADFGIYTPLIKRLRDDDFFHLEIIAFGTHLSRQHGYTIQEIESYHISTVHQIHTLPSHDSPEAVSFSMGKTIEAFSTFWAKHQYDYVLCLGDRYEMFAAVSAGTPFNMKFAHIHAGETTLGAIDNAYRHSISLFSSLLFVSTDAYKQRAESIIEKNISVHNVGALSIDNLSEVELYSIAEFNTTFGIDLNKPSILSTFHPETIALDKNKQYIQELLTSFIQLKNNYQIIITLPNTDPMGQMIRDQITEFGQKYPEIQIVESFGMKGYLSCMKYCKLMIGNTSSGFVEASYFPKFVINLGDRQKGRIETKNIFTIPVSESDILKTVKKIEQLEKPQNEYIYGNGNSAQKIIEILKGEQ